MKNKRRMTFPLPIQESKRSQQPVEHLPDALSTEQLPPLVCFRAIYCVLETGFQKEKRQAPRGITSFVGSQF